MTTTVTVSRTLSNEHSAAEEERHRRRAWFGDKPHMRLEQAHGVIRDIADRTALERGKLLRGLVAELRKKAAQLVERTVALDLRERIDSEIRIASARLAAGYALEEESLLVVAEP